jgi:hypothetical protein
MTINLDQEKNLQLTAQEVYDILDLATQAADDNGFVSEYVYERAIYLYATVILFPKFKNEITKIISEENPLAAWQHCIEKGYLQDLIDKYSDELEFLAQQSIIWLENYVSFSHSARGLLGTIQDFSSDIVSGTLEKFQEINKSSDIQHILNIADEWGFTPEKTLNSEKKNNSVEVKGIDSLYELELI